MRIRNLLSLCVAVVLACAAREVLPALYAGVRVPWLAAVAAYFAARREPGWGFAAALWCGLAQDALDGMGWMFATPLFLGAWYFCQRVVKSQMQVGARAVAFVATGLALAHEAACFAALHFSGHAAAASPGLLLTRLFILAPAAAAAGFAVHHFTHRADIALGNVGEVQLGFQSH